MKNTRIYKIEDISRNNITVQNNTSSFSLFELLGDIFKPVEKKVTKKAVEEQVGSFLVYVDSLELAQQLIWTAIELGLTVAGDDQYGMKTKYPIRSIQVGDYLEFFGNTKYDIDWTNSEEWALSMNYKKAKYLSDNFFGILKKVQDVAKEKKQLEKESGKWPTKPTYYSLKLEASSINARTTAAREEEKKVYSSRTIPTTTIRNLGFAIEVDGKIYNKNLRDSIYYVV